MSLIDVNNLQKYFGAKQVFSNVSFKIEQGDHIALIGANGSGKTTLLKILIGELDDYSGNINRKKYLKIGYMQQYVCTDLSKTVYEEVLTVFEDLIKIERDIDQINKVVENMEEVDNDLLEKQMHLNDKFISLGGFTYKNRVISTLKGLGFDESEIYSSIDILSGGQKSKLQLAKLLLSQSDLILLDEPTNHLDIESIEWLETFLKDAKEAFIVISHDRYFIDKLANRVFEIENNLLNIYNGNYSKFLILKEERELSKYNKYNNTMKEIKRMEESAKLQKQWNREKSVRRAESKIKAIEKLKETLEKPNETPESINFSFQSKSSSGNDVLRVSNLKINFGEKELLKNVKMEIQRGERVFLIGPNGSGKTSFIKALLGLNDNYQGTIKFGTNVNVGYYDQLQDTLDLSKTVIDEIWDRYPNKTQTEIRNALAAFLFKGDDVFKDISVLSGGEKAKLLLLSLMLSGSNFIILDEPTNHLDTDSSEALEKALLSYDGTLIVISHDRYLINKLADKIYYLDNGVSTLYDGNYDYYLQKKQKNVSQIGKINTKQNANEYKLKKEQASILRKKKKQTQKLENRIQEIDTEIKNLYNLLSEPTVSSDYQKAIEINENLEMLKKEQQDLYELWINLLEEIKE